MDREGWRATVYGITKGRTLLSMRAPRTCIIGGSGRLIICVDSRSVEVWSTLEDREGRRQYCFHAQYSSLVTHWVEWHLLALEELEAQRGWKTHQGTQLGSGLNIRVTSRSHRRFLFSVILGCYYTTICKYKMWKGRNSMERGDLVNKWTSEVSQHLVLSHFTDVEAARSPGSNWPWVLPGFWPSAQVLPLAHRLIWVFCESLSQQIRMLLSWSPSSIASFIAGREL